MTQTGFNILLVSNVSADTFPNNTPSQFSTILADDIALPGGDWEVAVTNIMYPSNIASTTEEDKIEIFKYKDTYRTLLPVPERGEHESFLNRVTVSLNLPITQTSVKVKKKVITMSSLKKDVNLLEYMNSAFKTSKVDNLIKLKESKSKKGTKYILEVLKKDIVSILHPELRAYLGFKDDKPVLKGTHWAWSFFNPKATPPKKENQIIVLLDLRTQVKEHCRFKRSFQVEHGAKGSKTEQVFYTTELPLKFKEGKDDDLYWEPTLTLSMNPVKGKISLMKSKEIPADIATFERSVTFIRFDPTTIKTFGLEPLYIADFTRSSTFTIDFTPISIDKAKTVVDSEVDIYFEGIRELDSSMVDEPIATFKVDSDTAFKDPSSYLQPLNKKASAYNYKFEYDAQRQRYSVRTGKDTFLRLSPTLATILGFSNLADNVILPGGVISAGDCPVIDRAITSLYCYTNVVQSVYVGNVKAPLLLSCPYKKDPNSNVTQVEFLNPTYRKLNRNTLHQIDIAIYDEAGALVPFLFGKSSLNLHFRP